MGSIAWSLEKMNKQIFLTFCLLTVFHWSGTVQAGGVDCSKEDQGSAVSRLVEALSECPEEEIIDCIDQCLMADYDQLEECLQQCVQHCSGGARLLLHTWQILTQLYQWNCK